MGEQGQSVDIVAHLESWLSGTLRRRRVVSVRAVVFDRGWVLEAGASEGADPTSESCGVVFMT